MSLMFKTTATGAAVTNPAAAAETVLFSSPVLTSGPSEAPGAGQPTDIKGVINLTAGAGTTAVVIKLRQGNTTAGPQVGPSVTHTLAAAASAQIAYSFSDNSGAMQGGIQYSVTATQTGGTGAGTTNMVDMAVDV